MQKLIFSVFCFLGAISLFGQQPVSLRTTNGIAQNLTNKANYASGSMYRPLTVQSGTSGRGPFVIDFVDPLFIATRDPCGGWGYNQTAGGTVITSGEGGLRWNIEGHYDDGSGALKMESYLQAIGTNGSTNSRAIMFKYNKSISKFEQTILKGNSIDFKTDNAAGENGSTMLNLQGNNFTMYPVDDVQTSFQIKAGATSTSVLALGYHGVDSVMLVQPIAANAAQIYVNGVVPLYLFSNPGGGSAGGSIAVGEFDNSAVGVFSVGTSSASVKGIVVRGGGSQTGDLLQAQNTSSAVLCSISASGLNMSTNGYASYATDTVVSISATGWTNTFGKNAVVYLDGTGVTFSVKNSAGTSIYTNAVSLTGEATVLLQPGGAVITSGTGVTGRATPF